MNHLDITNQVLGLVSAVRNQPENPVPEPGQPPGKTSVCNTGGHGAEGAMSAARPSMSSRIILSALALGAVVVGGTAALPSRPPARHGSSRHRGSGPRGQPQPRGPRNLNHNLRETPPATRLADPGPLPPSLAGAHHGVQLRMDAQGNLLLQADLLHLFDFYLAGREEEGLDKVLTRIHRDLATQLREPALDQARDLLRRYVDYRIALQGLPATDASLDPGALRQRLDALNALRQQFQCR